MRKYILFTLVIFAWALFSKPSAADTLTVLDAVEVTGSRIAEDIKDVPAPAYVITSAQIAQSGARSVQELLERVPGVTGLINGASMAQSKGITVRGLNTEVLLLVDGIPMMNNSYGVGSVLGSPFDLRSISPGSVERIEVVKGASSAIYGSNAAAGVINVITKKGGEKNGGSVTLEGGNAGWLRGSVRGTAVLSGDARVTLGYARTREGETRIRLLPGGEYDKATDFDGNDYVFRVDKGAWSFFAELGDYDSKWNYYSSFSNRVEKNRQENDYRRFLLSYNEGGTSARVYYRTGDREIYDSSGFTSYGDRSLGASFNRRSEIFGLPAIWGLDWRHEKAEYENRDNPYGNSLPYDLTRNGLAPYAELTIPLGEVGLDVGLRYEHWDVDGGGDMDEFVPRFSLNWEDVNGGLWYATAGRFFSMPSFVQMFYRDAYWDPNPNLKPEKGWSYDLGFKNLKAKQPWSVGVFYMEADDKINYEYGGGGNGQYINRDKYRAWGAEAEITFSLGGNWTYTQGLSWIKAEEKDRVGDWARSESPRWDVSGRLNYARGPWNGELAFSWLSDRKINNNTPGRYSEKDIFTVDLAVAWEKGSDRVRLACRNLFDKEYVLNKEGYITPERRLALSYERMF